VGFFKSAAILVVPERCLLWLAGESLQGHIAFSLFEKSEFSSALAKWIAGNQLTIFRSRLSFGISYRKLGVAPALVKSSRFSNSSDCAKHLPFALFCPERALGIL
jgi:hypothetical protein